MSDDPVEPVPERPVLPDRAPDRETTTPPIPVSARPVLPDRSAQVAANGEPMMIWQAARSSEGGEHQGNAKPEG